MEEYDYELSEVGKAGAKFSEALYEELHKVIKEITKEEIGKRVQSLYIDEVLSDVVDRINAMLEPKVMEAIKREVGRHISRLDLK